MLGLRAAAASMIFQEPMTSPNPARLMLPAKATTPRSFLEPWRAGSSESRGRPLDRGMKGTSTHGAPGLEGLQGIARSSPESDLPREHGAQFHPAWWQFVAPDRIRTCGLCLRRAALYPAELRVLPNGAILADVGVTHQAPCRPARVAKRRHGGNKNSPHGELRFFAARGSPDRLENERHEGGADGSS